MENKNDLYKEAFNKTGLPRPSELNSLLNFASNTSEAGLLFLKIYAALQPDARKEFINYWKDIYGNEFSTDMAKDYINNGKKQKVASTTKEALSTSNSDANSPVKEIFTPLYGSEYSNDMVKYPNKGGETMTVEAGLSNALRTHIASLPKELAEELLEVMATGAKKN